MQEFEGTVRFAVRGANGLAWNATAGPSILSVHLEPTEWGWNAREHSDEYLALEVAQARPGDPVDDLTIDTVAYYIVCIVRPAWPDLPMVFPFHSELPAGIRDGKTDLYAVGDPDGEWFRSKLEASIRWLSGE